MQIMLRCGHCTKMSVSDAQADTCLLFDNHKHEISWVCRECGKENVMPLIPPRAKPVSQQAMPRMGIAYG